MCAQGEGNFICKKPLQMRPIFVFLGLNGRPCKASDKFIQLGWAGLEGHFATNLCQNLTVIERSIHFTKYQAISQQILLLFLLLPQINIL